MTWIETAGGGCCYHSFVFLSANHSSRKCHMTSQSGDTKIRHPDKSCMDSNSDHFTFNKIFHIGPNQIVAHGCSNIRYRTEINSTGRGFDLHTIIINV